MRASARLASFEDLDGLLAMLGDAEVSAVAEPHDRAESIWREMLAHPGTHVFVAEADQTIVATATLITAPNLLRDGRGHGFLENVVTRHAYRGRGFGKAVVSAALDRAWALGCHHVMLQSGRPDPRVHSFYENLGFEPGLRTAYVAIRPDR
jgi:GNAT superfamily N-acetyltransferase